MKEFSTFVGLHARNTLAPVLVLLGGMAGIETALFARAMAAIPEPVGTESLPSPDLLIHRAGLFWCCAVCFMLITVLLCLDGCSFSSQNRYTLGRLRISEQKQVLYQAVYHGLIYLLFAAVQIVLGFVLCRWYCAKLESRVLTEQLSLLTFYQSRLLHGFLPLEDYGIWLRNLLLLSALSVSSAAFSYLHRQKKFGISIVILAVSSVFLFPTGVNSAGLNLAFSVGTVLILLSQLALLLKKTGGEEDA